MVDDDLKLNSCTIFFPPAQFLYSFQATKYNFWPVLSFYSFPDESHVASSFNTRLLPWTGITILAPYRMQPSRRLNSFSRDL